jgi:hypothetical protein
VRGVIGTCGVGAWRRHAKRVRAGVRGSAKSDAQGSAASGNRDSYVRTCAGNHKYLIRQAAQLQREAVSARLRSGAEAPGPTHYGRGVMALAARSRRGTLVAASAMPRATSSRGPGAAAYAESLGGLAVLRRKPPWSESWRPRTMCGNSAEVMGKPGNNADIATGEVNVRPAPRARSASRALSARRPVN